MNIMSARFLHRMRGLYNTLAPGFVPAHVYAHTCTCNAVPVRPHIAVRFRMTGSVIIMRY